MKGSEWGGAGDLLGVVKAAPLLSQTGETLEVLMADISQLSPSPKLSLLRHLQSWQGVKLPKKEPFARGNIFFLGVSRIQTSTRRGGGGAA